MKYESTRLDLNQEPLVYKTSALPIELQVVGSVFQCTTPIFLSLDTEHSSIRQGLPAEGMLRRSEAISASLPN